MNTSNMQTRTIRVRGIVQGVGFRPTVWRYANQLGLSGQVINDSQGVLIECKGSKENIDKLIYQLEKEPPAQARISKIEHGPSSSIVSRKDFVIAESTAQKHSNTGISPDLATCSECLTETLQPNHRRSNYPFTNCTHCGPRLSIVRALPYDRVNTCMHEFKQCTACKTEYNNPADRRFHAQPNACHDCGPKIWLTDNAGNELDANEPLCAAQQLLRSGKILAIKGIGGFQLAVDATNVEAVKRLRFRKHRPDKPFALMARDINVIKRYCSVTSDEAELLHSAAAPIVLLPSFGDIPCLQAIAPQQNRLGFMLPNSPLHHLLLQPFSQPLIMTSGNASGQPQCIDNQQAYESLDTIADAFLLHNRNIVNRVDDSVVQIHQDKPQTIRRARGYAPAPLPLPSGFDNSPDILALGGDLKNTFCLVSGEQAVLSQHIGDLRDARTLADLEHNVNLYTNVYQHETAVIAVDQHPQYLSSQLGRQLAKENNKPVQAIQHHHAHVAACLGDNLRALNAPPVLAIVLDGMGYAEVEGAAQIWGGEVLIADYTQALRCARLKPVPLIGGNIAMQQPWRSCFAQIHIAFGWSEFADNYSELAFVKTLVKQPISSLLAMLRNDLNSPLSSSCGRLFDAVSFASGLHDEQTISFEGQAAIALQSSIKESDWHCAIPYTFEIQKIDDLLEIDPKPMWQELIDDLLTDESVSYIAARFHLGLAKSFSDCVARQALENNSRTVVLTGGVMQNLYLQSALTSQLNAKGLKVLCHQQTPANDGGIAFGQALIAAARSKQNSKGKMPCV